MLSISTNTVLRLIRQAAEQAHEPVVPKRIADLELDEFWSFVEKKKRHRWTWYAFDRKLKQITAFVNGRRTDHNCASVLKSLLAAASKDFTLTSGNRIGNCCRRGNMPSVKQAHATSSGTT